MSYKQHNKVYFNKESLDKINEGLELSYKAVSGTLGARGRNVTIHHYNHNQYEQKYALQNTKDGVTVIKSIYTLNPELNVGIDLLKQTCDKTVKEAGDGTTTTAILAYKLFNNVYNLLKNDNDVNIYQLKEGIETALKDIISFLDKNKVNINDKNELYNIAMISSNNNIEISKLVSDMLWKYGKDCNVNIKKSMMDKMYTEENKGIIIERGYLTPALLDKNSDKSKELVKCNILLTDEEITNVSQIKDILEYSISNKNGLLIVAKDFKGDVLSTIMINKEKGNLENIMLVKAPDFDYRCYERLKDISVALNCKVISKYEGYSLTSLNKELTTVNINITKSDKLNKILGYSEKVVVNIEKTIIEFNKEDETINNNIVNRITEMENEIAKEEQINTDNRDWVISGIKKRIANLKGAITTIYINGNSELEISEKIDRVDDCINSVKCALEEGYVIGGGMILVYASENLSDKFGNHTKDFIKGYNIMKNVIKSPAIKIIENAVGVKENNYYVEFFRKILQANESSQAAPKDALNCLYGCNVLTMNVENFMQVGIIDSVKVTKTALINATSLASTLITTDCLIINSFIPE